MRLLSILFLVILTGALFSALSDKDKALLDRSLALYESMNRGTYKIKTVLTAISNGRHWLRQELQAAGQVYAWTMSFPAKAPPRDRPNTLSLLGGSFIQLQYSRQILGPFSIIGGPAWRPGELLWSVGVSGSF